jgi:hypothetical protein
VSGNKSWISLKCTSDGRLHVTNVLLLVQLVEDFVASGLDCGAPETDTLGSVSFPSETEISVSSLFYYHLFAITFKNLFSAGTRVSRQFNPTVSVTMEAETQTEEEQVNIIKTGN